MIFRPITLWAFAFLAYAGASLLWSPGNNLLAGAMLVSLAGCYLVGQVITDLRKVWITYCLFLLVNLALIPFSPFDLNLTWGLYGNKNLFGCALALGLAGAVAYRLWPFALAIGAGVFYTHSRSALLGLTAVCFVLLWRWSRPVAVTAIVLAAIATFETAPGIDSSIWHRMGIWNDVVNNATVFGSGFGSFYEAYFAFPFHRNPTEYMTGLRAAHAYNDFLELSFELGLGAIPLWVVVFLAMEEPAHERIIVFAYLAMALTFYPLWVPLVGQLVALTLGHLARHSVGTSTKGACYEISSRHSALPR